MLASSPLPISRPCNSPWRWEKDTKNLLPPDFISPSRHKPFSQNREHVGLHLALVKGEVKESAVAKLPKRESNSSPLSTFQDTDAQNLKQLIQSKRLEDAKNLYVEMRRKCLEPGIVLESVLIDACMKSGRFSDAFWVFEEMPERNVVTWTSMISGCVRNNQPGKGFSLFVDMLESGFLPNDFSLNAALQACAALEALDHGRQVHSLIVRSGLEDDNRTGNCLIDFYSKCRLMDKALLVSDALLEPDLVTFTSLITGFCKNNMLESAIRVFDQLVRWGLEPNQHTITSVLSACDPPLGEQIHGYMIKTKLDQSLYSSTSLIEFYSKNNAIEEAKLIFSNLKARSVVTWSSMISCCLRNEQVDDALKLFYEMFQSGIKHNEFTLASGIRACGLCAEQIGLGRQLHCSIIKLYLESDDHIINALLTMYARNGEIEEFEKVFKKIRDPDVVSWCAAISGYFQNGFYEKSTNLLCQMHRKGYTPNEYGFSSAISSSANLSLLDQGRQFHCFALKLGCDDYLCTGNALVNMYAKCGCVNDARLTFDIMPTLDLMSWNSLIYGYANFGNGREALEIFDQMVEINCMTPDQSTFVGLLVACNHMGFVDEGLMFFEIMQSQYGITPSAAHYACIVDMMGRSERFPEAVEIISKMPFEPDTMMWKTLLGSCKLHKNLEMGKLIAERVIQFSPEDSSSYVLLSNLHAMHGEWVDADRVRKLMEDRGVKKDAAWSWIECKNIVHAFVARDESHPRAEDIYKKLEELMKVMTEEGYSPDLNFVTDDL